MTSLEKRKSVNDETGSGLSPTTPKPPRFSPAKTTGPRVFVKVRQPISDENSIEVSPDSKTLFLSTEEGLERQFDCDRIFQNESTQDIFTEVVEEVVIQGMRGVSSVVVTMGTDRLDQELTFYGDLVKYENRGILVRAFEKIFQLADVFVHEVKYTVSIGMVEVRRDKILDLISLSPDELKTIGPDGPIGMFLEPVECPEHAAVLIMRGLSGQKLLARTDWSNPHTLVFVQIEGERVIPAEERELMNYDPATLKSRITFANLASLPIRPKDADQPTGRARSAPGERVVQSNGCYFITPQNTPRGQGQWVNRDLNLRTSSTDSQSQACCPGKPGRFGEGIAVRRDLLFLEQMFMRVSELQKLHKFYSKLKFVGMQGIMRNPSHALSQYYRQNKLCNCLRDLVGLHNEVRLLLHFRPDPAYVPTVFECLRFVDRLRLLPRSSKPEESNEDRMNDLNYLRQEIRNLKEELERLGKATELTDSDSPVTPSRAAVLQNQVEDYVTGRLDRLDVESKAEAKALFENFRSIYQLHVAVGKPRRKSGSLKHETTSKEWIHMKVRKSKTRIKSDGPATVGRKKSKTRSKKKESKLDLSGGEKSKSKSDSNSEPALEPGEDGIEMNLIKQHGNLTFTSKDDALEAFLHTPPGSLLHAEVNYKQKYVDEKTFEHLTLVQTFNSFLQSYALNKSAFDAMQQSRHTRGDEYDNSGNIVNSKAEKDAWIELKVMQDTRDEMLEGIKTMKMELLTGTNSLKRSQAEFETAFEMFSLDSMIEIPNPEIPAEKVEEAEIPCNFFTVRPTTAGRGGENYTKNFPLLKSIAEEQAKGIVKYYKHPPPWRQYC